MIQSIGQRSIESSWYIADMTLYRIYYVYTLDHMAFTDFSGAFSTIPGAARSLAAARVMTPGRQS